MTLALVGTSGSGKSTIVSLIERFYDPQIGLLNLDNANLMDLNIRWLRSQIGIVSQEPVLFNVSIRDNIRYGASFREVSDEEIIEAAKVANVHEFITSLPYVSQLSAYKYGHSLVPKCSILEMGGKARGIPGTRCCAHVFNFREIS